MSFLWKNGVGLAVTFIGERHLRSRIELSRNVFFIARDRPRLPQHFRAKPAVFVPIAVFFLKQYHWRLGNFQSNARKKWVSHAHFFFRARPAAFVPAFSCETSRVCPNRRLFLKAIPLATGKFSIELAKDGFRARIFLRASRNGVEHS